MEEPWQATVHGVAKSQIQVSMNACLLLIFIFFQGKYKMVVKKTNSGAKLF